MYFAGLTLNMMTLSGLSLGIGMLVDNSIVVMENVFRLRGRGLPAPRAAVQGTKQVTGAIIASTLTTVCVFLPMIFTSGTVRELLVPMALSISFCLLASLVVAMSVVPASGSTILRRVTPKENRFMDRVQESYGKSLRWCLRHKLPVLGAAAGLLILCGIRLIMMGIVILPEMSGDDIQVTIVTPEEDTREESYAKVDKVMEAVMGLEDVESVGITDQSSTAGPLTSGLSSSSSDSSTNPFDGC
jgi:multidrug efflux pump subunit AcrB